jgi:hypothetical protein
VIIDFSGGSPQRSPPATRYVPIDAAKRLVEGREADVVRALGIHWNGHNHIRCPYSGHEDRHPSWRLMASGLAVCTCSEPDSVFDIAIKLLGVDFEEAKIRVAELLGRPDLIIEAKSQNGLTLEQFAEIKGLPVNWLRQRGLWNCSYKRAPAVGVPYLNERGDRQTIQFRTSDGQYFKKGSKVCLFGAHQAVHVKNVGCAVIVEGVSDTPTLWCHGFPAFGLPGAAGWNEARDRHLFDDAETIFVVIEPDEGGEATMRWLARSQIVFRTRLVRMPIGIKNPSALYLSDRAGFQGAFQQLLDAAEPFPEADQAASNR